MNTIRPALNPYPLWAAKSQPAGASPLATNAESTAADAAADTSSLPETGSTDWAKATADLLEKLQSRYDNVNFLVVSDNLMQNRPALAASLGTGRHLVMTESFLTRMTGDSESFLRGQLLLEQAAGQLAAQKDDSTGVGVFLEQNKMTFWSAAPLKEKDQDKNSLTAMLSEMAKQSAKPNKLASMLQSNKNKSLYRSAMTAYRRISAAGSESSVRGAMAGARQNRAALLSLMRTGTQAEKQQARNAIAHLDQAILSGSKKIKNLRQEDEMSRKKRRLEVKKQQAQLKSKREKARLERMREELKKTKILHRLSEHAASQNGQMAILRDQLNDLEREQQQMMTESFSASDTSAAGTTGMEGIVSEGAASVQPVAVDVTFGASIVF